MGQENLGRIIKEGETNATPSVNVTKSTNGSGFTYNPYPGLSEQERYTLFRDFCEIIAVQRKKRNNIITTANAAKITAEKATVIKSYSAKALGKSTDIWDYMFHKYFYDEIIHNNNLPNKVFVSSFYLSKEPTTTMFVVLTRFVDISEKNEINYITSESQLSLDRGDIQKLKYMFKYNHLAVHSFYLTTHAENFDLTYDENTGKFLITLK